MKGRSISIRSITFRRGRIRLEISPDFLLFAAAAVSFVPLPALAAIAAASALHEAGHLLALRLLGARIAAFRLTALGAEIAAGTERLSYGEELLAAAAGPAVNLLCAAAFAWIGRERGYLYAGAHAMLGAFNLLPVPPLDGGRILSLAVSYRFGPTVGDAVAAVVGAVFSAGLLALGVYCTAVLHGGVFFPLAAAGLFLGTLPQLRLAKNAVAV